MRYIREIFLGTLVLAATFGLSEGLYGLDDTAKPDKAKKATPPKIGDQVEDLIFKDIRYLPRSLDDFGKKKAYVIVATNVSCPLVGRYWPKLKALDEEFGAQGVQFVALNVEPRDTIKELAAQAIEFGVPFPFVQDMDRNCVEALGLTTTAQVVILDTKQRLRYRGRIDDQYRFGGSRPEATRQELRVALTALLKGDEIEVAQTPVDGCKIELAVKAEAPKVVPTYSEHIAPILQQHCQDCHRPGGLAPFDLLSFDDASKNAAMIAEVVAERRMPPWYASEKNKGFINHRGLSEQERTLLISWSKTGAKRGDPSKDPKPRVFPNPKWQIGEPDLVLKVKREMKLPADGYVPYQYYFIMNEFPHDRWVQAIEIRPRNKRVLHHCNLLYTQIGKDGSRRNTTFVTGVVPGSGATFTEPGTAIRIPKGATLILQTHYTTTGKPETDQLSVGFVFARGKVRKELHNARAGAQRFAIPPGASHHEVRASVTIPRNAQAMALFAHMHLRGKDMAFIAHYPDGRKEELLLIPNYSFDWQQSYDWKLGTKLWPKGTRIEAVAHFDNSVFNPFNPDPTKTVRFGQQTFHEMMYGFVFYVAEDENLDLSIDPKTGAVIEPAKKEKKKAKKAFH